MVAERPSADQFLPVSAVRRRIAEHLRRSVDEAPHAWTALPVDVTGLVALRRELDPSFRTQEGVPLSYLPFFVKAAADALQECPLLRSQWAGDQIRVCGDINISVAVATDHGLMVPVLKRADAYAFPALARALADLVRRTHSRQLTLEDVSGGTFTLNNTGAIGSYLSVPIVNHPQAAILTCEAITRTPVVLADDTIGIRSVMFLCMSFDHRLLDGADVSRFLQAVRHRLEAYGPGAPAL